MPLVVAATGVHDGQTRLGIHAAMRRVFALMQFRRLSVDVVLGFFSCYGDGDAFILGMDSVREMGVSVGLRCEWCEEFVSLSEVRICQEFSEGCSWIESFSKGKALDDR